MPTLPRPNPSRDLISLRDSMDRMVEKNNVRSKAFWDYTVDGDGVPLDLYEDKDNLVVKATVPGVKPEDMQVNVENDVLTISGETKKDEERSDHDYYVRERRYGSFSRSLELPRAVNADQADAVFADGVLTLTLPKADEARGKQIQIKTK